MIASTHPINTKGAALWWKLAFVCAAILLLSLPLRLLTVLDFLDILYSNIAIPLFVPIGFLHKSLGIFLAVFCLWHWHTRHAGRYPLAWLIVFMLTSAEIFFFHVGFTFATLAYTSFHLIPDVRGRGAYAYQPSKTPPSPAVPLPPRGTLAATAMQTVGWLLIVSGLGHALHQLIMANAIWTGLELAAPNHVGETFSQSHVNTLWVASQVGKSLAMASLLSVLLSALGAILIHLGRSGRAKVLAAD
ncbi:MAG: hypothetical protein JJU29_15760 [Verrucomicrobia bacterium]|nr:hypothetical protein [Verrucomicrobiota bacterium]MCH8514000.1 hypothetical protein [Kiritimatiellia bacterium]